MINTMSIERDALAKRMEFVCDQLKLPKEKRQTLLAKKYGVSITTGRNWLLGLKIPDYETALKICNDANVNYEWLMSGNGLKIRSDTPEAVIVTDPIIIKMVKQVEPLDSEDKDLALEALDFSLKQVAQTKAKYEKK